MSASEGHITPTALTFHNGAFYIGNLGEFSIQQGMSKIYKVTPDGQVEVFAEGLTAVLGLALTTGSSAMPWRPAPWITIYPCPVQVGWSGSARTAHSNR